jgi:hypothetical protein
VLHVNSEKLHQSSGKSDVWCRDYPEKDVSPGRRRQAWGWVNKKFFPADFVEQFELEDAE